MKNILLLLLFFGAICFFVYALIHGADLEAKRQCLVARQNCKLYADAGACNPKFMKICEGIENEK